MCDIPVLIIYGSSGISYQATMGNMTTSGSLFRGEIIDISYDLFSPRLFFYDELENFYSIEQDGSDLRRISAKLSKAKGFNVTPYNSVGINSNSGHSN